MGLRVCNLFGQRGQMGFLAAGVRVHLKGGGCDQVFLVDQDAVLEDIFQNEDGLLGHADVDLVDAAAEQRLTQTLQKVGDTQGGYQQGRAFLVDQAAQHQSLDEPGQGGRQHGRP